MKPICNYNLLIDIHQKFYLTELNKFIFLCCIGGILRKYFKQPLRWWRTNV